MFSPALPGWRVCGECWPSWQAAYQTSSAHGGETVGASQSWSLDPMTNFDAEPEPTAVTAAVFAPPTGQLGRLFHGGNVIQVRK